MSRSVEQLVNQQVLRWLEQQRVQYQHEQVQSREVQRPMLCISREFGALGGEIGRIVAEKLGFSFYAQELVHEVAKEAHVRKKVVESLDERIQSRINQRIGEMVSGGSFAATDYLHNLSKVVLTLGRHGKGVIIGRGAHLILDPKLTLRVRAYGPLESRVAHIAKREHMSPQEARAKVLRVDAERIAFYRQHFNVDVGSEKHFDLLLNTSEFSMEVCANLVIEAYKGRFFNGASS
jgi:cytidylate kinase